MSKAGFWKKDWFLGLAVSLVLLLAGGSQVIQSLERTAYDWGVRASSRIADPTAAPSEPMPAIAATPSTRQARKTRNPRTPPRSSRAARRNG